MNKNMSGGRTSRAIIDGIDKDEKIISQVNSN